MESIYIALSHIAQSALTLIITLKDQESHPHVILSQLPRNNSNKVNKNNTHRKRTVRLPVRRSETHSDNIIFHSLVSGIQTCGGN